MLQKSFSKQYHFGLCILYKKKVNKRYFVPFMHYFLSLNNSFNILLLNVWSTNITCFKSTKVQDLKANAYPWHTSLNDYFLLQCILGSLGEVNVDCIFFNQVFWMHCQFNYVLKSILIGHINFVKSDNFWKAVTPLWTKILPWRSETAAIYCPDEHVPLADLT